MPHRGASMREHPVLGRAVMRVDVARPGAPTDLQPTGAPSPSAHVNLVQTSSPLHHRHAPTAPTPPMASGEVRIAHHCGAGVTTAGRCDRTLQGQGARQHRRAPWARRHSMAHCFASRCWEGSPCGTAGFQWPRRRRTGAAAAWTVRQLPLPRRRAATTYSGACATPNFRAVFTIPGKAASLWGRHVGRRLRSGVQACLRRDTSAAAVPTCSTRGLAFFAL